MMLTIIFTLFFAFIWAFAEESYRKTARILCCAGLINFIVYDFTDTEWEFLALAYCTYSYVVGTLLLLFGGRRKYLMAGTELASIVFISIFIMEWDSGTDVVNAHYGKIIISLTLTQMALMYDGFTNACEGVRARARDMVCGFNAGCNSAHTRDIPVRSNYTGLQGIKGEEG